MKCKICGSEITLLFDREVKEAPIKKMSYFTCNECNCIQAFDMDKLTKKQLDEWYDYPNYRKYDPAGQGTKRKSRTLSAVKYITDDLGKPCGKLLLHGAGEQELEERLDSEEVEVWSTFSTAKGKRYSVNTKNLPSEYFDAIVANEVIEHWTHPHKEFSLLKRIMKPGAIFVGSTGIMEYLKTDLPKWDYISSGHARGGHVLVWSIKALDYMCNKYGFSNLTIHGTKRLREGSGIGISQGFVILQKK